MAGPVVIDGSYGEGGGQIVRNCLALAAVTGRAVCIENIRARRPKPGLAAQHLTAVRAAAAICGADVAGDALKSTTLEFAPRRPPQAGLYTFDVAAAREGGSAGSATLVLQTVLIPLAFAAGRSEVLLRGGTHVQWSPPFDYARDVWLPALARLGIEADLELRAWGFLPVGLGEMRLRVEGLGEAGPRPRLAPIELVERGAFRRVFGRAVAANLPAHIAQRMADRARTLLEAAGVRSEIEPLRTSAACPGAGIWLTAEFESARLGAGALGRVGKPAEVVAEEAVAALLESVRSGAAADLHLGDQLVLPLSLADGLSAYTAERITSHLVTAAWVVERFGLAEVRIEADRAPPRITVAPRP